MKKKITAIVLCVAMLAIAIAGGTLAYFTDTEAETNVIVVGNVSAELYESRYHRGANSSSYLYMEGQPENLTDNDIAMDSAVYHEQYLPSATLMPFNLSHKDQAMFEECTVAKNAYVQNTSKTNDCFVRVRYMVPENVAPYLDMFYVDTQFISAEDEIAKANARDLDNTDKSEPVITAVTPSGANFTLQGTKYINEDGKGYWVAEFIYAERLTPGEFTLYSPISKVTMIPSVDNEIAEQITNADRQFDIIVEADVIQADGFLNALEAFAAFDEQ